MRTVLSAALGVVALLLITWAATDGAPAPGLGAEGVVRIKREQFCEPNSTFQLDCNDCICEPDGQGASCTAMECPDRRRRRRGAEGVVRMKREEFCEPNSTFLLDFDECVCDPDGEGAYCTSMEVPDRRRRRRDVLCQPGTTLKRDTCETCICLDDGKTLTCTDVLCSKRNS